jgi:hypothetical protein
MVYRSHIYLQAGGRLFGSEIWSIGLRMAIGGTMTDEPPSQSLNMWEDWTEDNVADVFNDVSAYMTSGSSGFSDAARLDYVKFNVIGPDGRYRNKNKTVAFYYSGNDAPRGTALAGPAQLAVVVSLLTDAQRGRAHRGRYYIPAAAMGVDSSTGRLPGATVASMATSAKNFINNLNNQPGIDVNNPRVIVASELESPGLQRDVTSIAVGNVLDTQRRRRNAFPEVYTELPVTIVQ